MKGWRDPVGPEEPRTYWLRRGVILVLIVALVTVGGWLVTRNRDANLVAQAQQSSAPSTSASTTPAAPAEPSTTPQLSATPSASAEAGMTASATPTPTPVACIARQLTLRVEGPAEVNGPDPVAFKVVVATAQAQCVLDLGVTAATLVVTSGNDRIWATSDCPDWQPVGTFSMVAGQEASYEVGWPVRRSSGCELRDTTLGAGTYVATAAIGSASARHVMQLQP